MTKETWDSAYRVNIHYFLNVCEFSLEQDRQTEMMIKQYRMK